MVKLNGKEVGSIGYGLMGFTWADEPVPYDTAFPAMKAAVNLGALNFNGGSFYGPPESNSLTLCRDYFAKHPEDADKVVLSIKTALDFHTHQLDASAAGMRKEVETCLRILDGKKFLDLVEACRVDPKVPIEETVGALAEYVKAGKIGGISLSECSANSIRRAAKVHPIAAVEVEFSMFSTDILHNGVAKACADHNIPVIAYSPLGRGMLTGQVKSRDDLNLVQKHMPRFDEGNFEENLKLVDEVAKIAEAKGATPGQVAIAWVKAHSQRDGLPVILPIPGASKESRVQENMKNVTLSEAEFKELNDVVQRCEVKGDRYGGPQAALMAGDSPELKA